MILVFSGDLITQIQDFRHQNQIEKINQSETIAFSETEWNNFNNADEIKFQNNYYDVISIKKSYNKIIAKVVKDDFESEIRIGISKIFKNKKPISHKKKTNSISKHLISKADFLKNKDSKIHQKLIQKSDGLIHLKTSNFINFQEKPPCKDCFYFA